MNQTQKVKAALVDCRNGRAAGKIKVIWMINFLMLCLIAVLIAKIVRVLNP